MSFLIEIFSMRRFSLYLAILVSVLVAWSPRGLSAQIVPLSPAEPVPAREVVTELSFPELLSLLVGEGFIPMAMDARRVTVIKDARVMVFAISDQTLSFYYAVANVPLAPAQINAWNRGFRFSRAYLDDDGDPSLETDLDLEGGVTRGAVTEWVRTNWYLSTMFRTFLAAQRPAPDSSHSPSLPRRGWVSVSRHF